MKVTQERAGHGVRELVKKKKWINRVQHDRCETETKAGNQETNEWLRQTGKMTATAFREVRK